jgi:hypothetical protein
VKTRLSPRLLLALLGTIVVCTISCGDYAIQLPRGYSLVRVYSGTLEISRPDRGMVIPATVDRYAVIGSLIIGHTSLAREEPERDLSKPGYFIIDTQSDGVKQGLDKNSWLESLRLVGIMSEPKLHSPSRFDKNYR